MANEIKDITKRAAEDMKKNGILSRGTYFDIVDHALNGEKFSVQMSAYDVAKMRQRFTRRHLNGVMHQHSTKNGSFMVSFNQ